MPDENNRRVLAKVMNDHKISPQDVAAEMGYSRRSGHVNQLLNHESRNIPAAVYAALIKLTGCDQRIPECFMEDTDFMVIDRPKIDLAKDLPRMQELIKLRQALLDQEKAILNIFADGKVTRGDREQVLDLERIHPKAIQMQMQIYATVMVAFEKFRK